MSVLPIITPPFVIGLALILLFGRSGALSAVLWEWFGVPRSRWIYGLPGVLIAQLLAFTPIAFLVLIGVVQGISPTLEEASQTLRAKSWTTFWTVTLAAHAPGPRQRLPARLRGKPRRFRQSAGARRQLRGAVHQDLLRRRGRAAGSGPGRRALHHPARLHARRLLAPARLARQEGLHDGDRQGRCGPSPAPAAARGARLLSHGDPVGALHRRHLCDHRHRRLRALHGPRLHADPRAFPHRLPHRARRLGPLLLRLRLELVLRHHQGRGALRAAHRRHRPAHRLSADPPALLRPARLRVRHAAELRHPRHGRRRVLHPRLQRAADRDHRHGLHPRDVLRVPQHAGGRALRHRHLEPDRQEPRRGFADAGRALVHHHAPRGAAAAAAGHRRVAGLFLRARHDGGERRDLPRHRRVQHGDDLYRRPRRGGRVRPRHRLFHRAHRRHAGRHRGDPAGRRRAAPRAPQRERNAPRPLPCRRSHEQDVLRSAPSPASRPSARSRRRPSSSAT